MTRDMANGVATRRRLLLYTALTSALGMTTAAQAASVSAQAGFTASPAQGRPAIPSLPVAARAAMLPGGGKVVAGQATIGTPDGSNLTIRQGSAKAIIDWDGFSIGTGGTVWFDNGRGATLNRVTGGSVSSIDGRLGASGSVYLLNPNGVIIGEQGVVDVGGSFVGSTLGLSNQAFLTGGPLTLGGASTAAVVNLGHVGALGGDVVLAGYSVVNRGSIASGGTAGLLAGQAVLLSDRDAGDGRFAVLASEAGANATNTGAIEAVTAELRANGGSIHALAGNTRGIINATGVANEAGRVFLTTGNGGSIDVADTDIAAAGAGATVRIGTADTGHTHIGDGVTVTTGADGFIETSARQLDIGVVRIDPGAGGLWLLDPVDVTIDEDLAQSIMATLALGRDFEVTTAGGGDGGSDDGDDGGIPPGGGIGGGGGTIDDGDDGDGGGTRPIQGGDDDDGGGRPPIGALGGFYSVALDAPAATPEGNITVAAAIHWSTDASLRLLADNDIIVNAPITATGAGAGLVLEYAGALDVHAPVTLSGASATLAINGADYTLIHDVDQLQAMQGDLSGLYALGNDIDAAATAGWNRGAGFVPVGSSSTSSFTGRLAGLGHVVRDLTIERTDSSYTGLFGYIGTGGVVRDIGLEGGAISGGFSHTGALAGGNGGAISASYATGVVSGDNYVGGLVGWNDGGTISASYATGAVSGLSSVGGLVGWNDGGTISTSYAIGAVSGITSVGGLVGWNNGSITASHAAGEVTDDSYIDDGGGLVGYNTGIVTTSFYDQDTTGQSFACGYNLGTCDVMIGLTTANAFNQASYDGFDFTNDWFMIEGSTRPFLRAEWSTSISNAHQLQLMAMDLDADYTLANDIDASATAAANPSGMWAATGFVPVGTSSTSSFTGTLDGRGHVVHDLTIERTDGGNYTGLFGYIGAGGVVRDIGLEGGTVSGGGRYTGALVGVNRGAISASHAVVDVTGAADTGGLAGYNAGTIDASYAAGTVEGDAAVGGLVGWNAAGGAITNAYATGVASGSNVAIGGLVGENGGTIDASYATGTVSGDSGVGGLVGHNVAGGAITNAYATGVASGNNVIGGLAGYNVGTIDASYATGAASGDLYVAWLVGYNADTVTTSFYRKPTTGWSFACGFGTCDATGLTTAQMQDPFTFIDAGWDFTGTWSKSKSGENGGYMMLRAFGGDLHKYFARFSGDGSKVYGDTNFKSSFVLTIDGPDAGVVQAVSSARLNAAIGVTTDAGEYALGPGVLYVEIHAADPSDFYIGYDGALTVTPRPITVTAADWSRIYGEDNPALSWTVGGRGLVNGDTLSGALATGADAGSDVGEYTIGQGSLTASANYALSFTPGTLTVFPRAITVTAADLARIYGEDNPALSWTVGGLGLVNGDTLSGALATGADAGSDVGDYVIGQGDLSASANYALSFTPGTLTVDPRAITVTAADLARIYGEDNPALSWTVGGRGLVNGDTLSGALATDAGTGSDVGDYVIGQGSLAASPNYDMTFASGTLSVTPRPLVVVADDQDKYWNADDPLLGWTLGGMGLVNGDTLGGSLVRVPGEAPGAYEIGQGSLMASGNYAVDFRPGTLTIAPVLIEAGLPFERSVFPPLAASASAPTPTPTQACTQDRPCLTPYPANLDAGAAIRFTAVLR